MFTEQLNQLVEQEVESRHSELKAEMWEVTQKLMSTEKELNELKTLTLTLKDKSNQLEAFNTFKSLIKDVNFSNILLYFNLKKNNHTINGMNSDEIPSWFKLLFTYYEDREKLFTIMDLFDFKYPSWAKKYKMPYEYNEEELGLFINPKYRRSITNGQMFKENTGFFWRNIQENKGDTNKILTAQITFADDIPWQLVLSNPLWKEDKMFNKILNALYKKENDSHFYFCIQDYQEISKEQVKEMSKYLPKQNFV